MTFKEFIYERGPSSDHSISRFRQPAEPASPMGATHYSVHPQTPLDDEPTGTYDAESERHGQTFANTLIATYNRALSVNGEERARADVTSTWNNLSANTDIEAAQIKNVRSFTIAALKEKALIPSRTGQLANIVLDIIESGPFNSVVVNK